MKNVQNEKWGKMSVSNHKKQFSHKTIFILIQLTPMTVMVRQNQTHTKRAQNGRGIVFLQFHFAFTSIVFSQSVQDL